MIFAKRVILTKHVMLIFVVAAISFTCSAKGNNLVWNGKQAAVSLTFIHTMVNRLLKLIQLFMRIWNTDFYAARARKLQNLNSGVRNSTSANHSMHHKIAYTKTLR